MSPVLSESESSRTLELDDALVRYHDVGEGDPILIIGCFGPRPGTSAWLVYAKALEDLATRFRCIVMDLPGWNGSRAVAREGEPGHHMIARNAIALLDHLGIDALPVVGNSVGGTTGIVMGIEYPSRVTKLVVGGCHASTGGDPYLLAPSPPNQAEVMRLFIEEQASAPDRSKIERLMRAIVFNESLITSEMIDAMYDARVAAGSSAPQQFVQHSNLAQLHELAMPMLIIHGRYDRMVPIEQGLMLFSYVASSTFVGINNCGHWPPFDQPEMYARHVRNFLDAPSGP